MDYGPRAGIPTILGSQLSGPVSLLLLPAFWPARLGHCSLTLLPFEPWQAIQVAALVAPASADPLATAIGVAQTANSTPTQRVIDIICYQLPPNGSFSLQSKGIFQLYTSLLNYFAVASSI